MGTVSNFRKRDRDGLGLDDGEVAEFFLGMGVRRWIV